MPATTLRAPQLSLQNVNDFISWTTGAWDQFRFQIVKDSGTWGLGVITLEHSIDGVTWFALDTPITFAAAAEGTLYPAAGASQPYLVNDGMVMLRARVSTSQVGACAVSIWIAATTTSLESLTVGEYTSGAVS